MAPHIMSECTVNIHGTYASFSIKFELNSTMAGNLVARVTITILDVAHNLKALILF
jgi:hypothetical protein